jgi:hypothetical protein
MNKTFIYLLILCCLLTGCASASVARYPSAHTYLPTNPNNVAVYTNFPPTEYETIGEIEGSGAPAATWGSVAWEMRKKAAEIGGDAVILLMQDTPFVGTINTPGSFQGGTTGYGSSSGNISAYRTGNNVYGNYRGSDTYTSTSNYTYNPPTSTPLYGKYTRGVVIKYKTSKAVASFETLDSTDQESLKSWLAEQGVNDNE